jgi:diaminohydroxyphosphoribosylaminopyrimidine deaminase/5-amino-6-(5-phosphoribosylamino)uracil reductase
MHEGAGEREPAPHAAGELERRRSLPVAELDELRLFYAPLVLGGDDARPLISGAGSERVDAAERPLAVSWEPSGEDMLARVRMREW